MPNKNDILHQACLLTVEDRQRLVLDICRSITDEVRQRAKILSPFTPIIAQFGTEDAKDPLRIAIAVGTGDAGDQLIHAVQIIQEESHEQPSISSKRLRSTRHRSH